MQKVLFYPGLTLKPISEAVPSSKTEKDCKPLLKTSGDPGEDRNLANAEATKKLIIALEAY
jgi:hypothetical protein